MISKWPQGGDMYEAIEEIELTYIVHYNAPFTHGAKCTFPKHSRLTVCPPVSESSAGYYCVPSEYKAMENKLIPKHERSEPS